MPKLFKPLNNVSNLNLSYVHHSDFLKNVRLEGLDEKKDDQGAQKGNRRLFQIHR